LLKSIGTIRLTALDAPSISRAPRLMISRLSPAQHSYARFSLFLRAGLAINLSVIVFTIAVVKNAACGQEAAGSHQVPLLDDCVIVRIPVRMFNQTLYFVLDTGTSVSALDLSFREKLGPPISEIVDGMSVALGKKLTLYRCPDFSVDDTHGNLQRIACLDLTMFRRVSGAMVSWEWIFLQTT
jgi:hypothetical protein